ncbi:MAG: TlpA disulfide reductase family protein [Acidobacteriaceae bacterium]
MKRSSLVVLVLIAGITAMIWAGVMAYRIRKALHGAPPPIIAVQPEPGGTAAEADSPAAQGLPDLRGKAAPAFALKTIDGKTVSLEDYKGKAVLVNFWATWCGPCKVEMPWLIDLQKKYAGQGFTVLGISEDDGSPKNVADFAAKMGIDYPILLANDKVSHDYGGIDYLPTSYYIGRDGKVVAEIGGLISKQEMESNIQKTLAPAGSKSNAAAGAVQTSDTGPVAAKGA